MQTGQGLVWGSTFSLGKGSETITAIRKNSSGSRPYNSLTEYGYYKGITATADITNRISVTGVFSRKRLDARVTGDSIISFAETGYHRDSAENLLRKNVVEQVSGGSIRFQTRDGRFRSGINFCGINYSKTIAGNEDTYRIFNFSGQSAFYTGADYGYSFRNVSITGETASSSDGSLATIHGLIIALSPRIDYALSYRSFSKSYDNPYASGFGENTRTSNESGIYQGIKISPSRSVELSGYADIFRFPWLKYQIDAPTQGAEYMIKGIYRFSRKTNVYLQFREEIKEKTYLSDASDLYRKQTIAFNFTGSFEPFSINSRFIWNQTASPLSKGRGTALSNDLSLKTGKLETTLRFAIFDTHTYDNRLYLYEKDVLYSFSIPAYYGTGCRYYILTRLRIFRKTDLWLRYSKTVDLGQEKIGEEKPENQTGKGSELKVQIKYTF
jgi:hypothetical protein